MSGRVILEGAPSNAGSRVEVVGTDKIALTNEKGDFTITNLPSGSHVLLVRHLGFGAETVPVDLPLRAPSQVSVKLPKFVAALDPVLVTAKRVASRQGRIQPAQENGNGIYLGPDQIQAMHPNTLTDILRVVPSLHVQYTPTGDVVTSSRGTSPA